MRKFYAALQKVPRGRVVSYGQLAMLAGVPRGARMAGRAMSCAFPELSLPCHRVVHADGSLVGGWGEQRALLEAEGVGFLPSGRVDMKNYVWRIDINLCK
ncbi:MAG TPA: MGMT family protein [Candidatus Acidoferrum sp.]|nr:MGMT family protein [Candidatus Acidoferrum sp.]